METSSDSNASPSTSTLRMFGSLESPSQPNESGGQLVAGKNLKHFKKSMIVEYESHATVSANTEDSQCSTLSSASSSVSSSSFTMDTNSQSSNTFSPMKSPVSNNSQFAYVKRDSRILCESATGKKRKRTNSKGSSVARSDSEETATVEQQQTAAKNSSSKNSKKQSAVESKSSSKKSKSLISAESKSKADSSGKKKLYCVCRSADTQRFMMYFIFIFLSSSFIRIK
jgi:viroplasmin and RNaseH domain-containing protein